MKNWSLTAVFFLVLLSANARQTNYKIVAYYSGDSATLLQYDLGRITHLIYGFGHLDSLGKFAVFRAKDTAALKAFQIIKRRYPHLKTMIALGGWGGCRPCSGTFSHPDSIEQFSASVKNFLADFRLDGIDLDWEYPAIQGVPGHPFSPADQQNFTSLVVSLRKKLGAKKLVTFAAGGFQYYLNESVEWQKIAGTVDFVNLMTYDLVHGYSTKTGHQSSLYSAAPDEESVERAIRFFRKINFPLRKIVVGVPFYVRAFQVDTAINNGLFQPGKFLFMSGYRWNTDSLSASSGFIQYWDEHAAAPYWFNKDRKLFVTGDNKRSLQLKTEYIRQNHLGGIMFWELFYDTFKSGLLNDIRF
ncbi:glycoside hydrolase family 18 protein [Niabella ginsenosidivorans]|uniref:glycoside hydrolase family 18 protein n=1 Tax=Niabella ginsenosidivorans TaxID=1176587 RepID=UPI0009FF1FCF|nr:glycosyl hydrolase family 18 protein [Niabella ginsenosidivorans]